MTAVDQALARQPDHVGVRLIVVYKLIKGVVLGLGSAAVTALMATHSTVRISSALEALREEVVNSFTLKLVDLLLRALTPRHVYFLAAALAVDSVASIVQGVLLGRGYLFARWLVVGASGLLVPFELVSLWRHPHLGHVAILVVNLGIVAYLAWCTLRDLRKAQRSA